MRRDQLQHRGQQEDRDREQREDVVGVVADGATAAAAVLGAGQVPGGAGGAASGGDCGAAIGAGAGVGLQVSAAGWASQACSLDGWWGTRARFRSLFIDAIDQPAAGEADYGIAHDSCLSLSFTPDE